MTKEEAIEIVNREYRFEIENWARAYWWEAGKPVGRDDEFWHKAVEQTAWNLLEFGHPNGHGGCG